MKIFKSQHSRDLHQVVGLLNRPTKMKEAICQSGKALLQLGTPNVSVIPFSLTSATITGLLLQN